MTKLEDYEMIYEISVDELKDMLDKKDCFVLLDVRESYELEMSRIKEAKSVSLSRIMAGQLGWLENIDKNKNIVLYCKSGARSLQALNILRSKGYINLKSLSGGIDAWTMKIVI